MVALFLVLGLAFAGIGARLFTLQILDSRAYEQIAARQRERKIVFPARRGAILDRNGRPLAISLDAETVFADPAYVRRAGPAARKLAPLLGVEKGELERRLRGAFRGDRFEYLARQVPPATAKAVRRLDLPGIYLMREPRRYYPGGRLASQVLGFLNADGTPFGGIEGRYDELLQGRPGAMTFEEDPTGTTLPQAHSSETSPQPGRSLLLTIDREIQYFTEERLAEAVTTFQAESGSVIVMRPRTGEILAMANLPDFDPNSPQDAPTEDQRNAAVTDVYEPGSAFKLVTAAAALQTKAVTPRSVFTVPGELQVADRVINDSHDHDTEQMTVTEIIEQSSNVGTVKIAQSVGSKRLDRFIRRFGFGEETGLGFPGESPGIVIDLDDWSGSSIGTIPIGQGIAVTPLQLAAAYGVIANRGVWVEPKLVRSTFNSEGRLERSPAPAARRVVSRRTAAQVSRILTRVVTHGTGIEAQIPGYSAAGKTGTAQRVAPGGGYGGGYVASFGGYAPAHRPEIVVLVKLDDPSPIWGGYTAAPAFSKIAGFTLRRLGVAPSRPRVRRTETPLDPASGGLPPAVPGNGF